MAKRISGYHIAIVLIVSLMVVVWDTSGIQGQNGGNGGQVITVGAPGAGIEGFNNVAVQRAIDTLKKSGGGTVKLTPGTFEIEAPIRLYGGMSLIGAGQETVLHKVNGCKSPLSGETQKVRANNHKVPVVDASGFEVGMGVHIYDDVKRWGWNQTAARIIDIQGNDLYVDTLAATYSADYNGMVLANCSLVEVVGSRTNKERNIHIANFLGDGNRQNNRGNPLTGNRGGGVYVCWSSRCLIENVKIKNFNGDGITWQGVEDTTVKNCEVYGCSNLGFHPGGADSINTKVVDCIAHDNARDGIFLCARVTNGIYKNNKLHNNRQNGISIGFLDTDNVFENNHIYGNGKNGIYLRNELEPNAGHRNKFYNNLIENNGTVKGGKWPGGYGVYIDGFTHDLVIENNIIRDTGGGSQIGGIYIGTNASKIIIGKNEMSGHSQGDITDDR